LEKDNNIHLVKKVSKELGMTYKELGEAIGYSEGALRKAVSKNILSPQLKRALELYLEIKQLKENQNKVKKTKEILEELLQKSIKEKEILETFLNDIIKKIQI
jgi:predicted transcriptional regulator